MAADRRVLPVQDGPLVQTAHYDAEHEDVEYAPLEVTRPHEGPSSVLIVLDDSGFGDPDTIGTVVVTSIIGLAALIPLEIALQNKGREEAANGHASEGPDAGVSNS